MITHEYSKRLRELYEFQALKNAQKGTFLKKDKFVDSGQLVCRPGYSSRTSRPIRPADLGPFFVDY